MAGGKYGADCSEVSADCPVGATVYDTRHGFYTFWIACGAAGEVAGYAGRIALHYNPWNNSGFEDQISTLIFSPSFFAAAIYLTLKHMVRAVGPEFSAIPPNLYPWIFIVCDFISLILQAAGGGTAAGADTNKVSEMGGHIMLAGIVFQVSTFTALYGLVALYIFKLRNNRSSIKPEVSTMLGSREFKIFVAGIFIASLAIYIRCVYRIVELAAGWSNNIMRNEAEYMVLDGTMSAIAVLALTVAHSGIWFRSMITKVCPGMGVLGEKHSDEDNSDIALKTEGNQV